MPVREDLFGAEVFLRETKELVKMTGNEQVLSDQKKRRPLSQRNLGILEVM